MRKIDPLAVRGYLFSLALAILTYFFYALIINNGDKYFTVPLNVVYPDNLVASSATIDSVNIAIRGNSASLARISREDMEAILDLSNENENGIVFGKVRLRRSGVFADINNVEIDIDPAEVEVTLEDRVTVQIPIEASFINSSPRGFLFRNYTTNPKSIELTGPRSIISNMNSVSSENIDLSLYTSSINKNVELLLPDFVNVATGATPTVRVFLDVVESIIVETYQRLPIVTKNLRDGFSTDIVLKRADLVVKGAQLTIEEMSPVLFVDLASIQRAGTYNFSIQAELPTDIEIVSINPEQIRFIVNRNLEIQTEVEQEDVPAFIPSPNLSPAPDSIIPPTIPPVEIPNDEDNRENNDLGSKEDDSPLLPVPILENEINLEESN